MEVQCNTVLYPVRDPEKAKALFTALFGAPPHVDSPFYIGFSVNGAEIGLVPNGHDQGMTGPVPFYDVDDISTTLGALQSAGEVGARTDQCRGRNARRQGQRRRRQRNRRAPTAFCVARQELARGDRQSATSVSVRASIPRRFATSSGLSPYRDARASGET